VTVTAFANEKYSLRVVRCLAGRTGAPGGSIAVLSALASVGRVAICWSCGVGRIPSGPRFVEPSNLQWGRILFLKPIAGACPSVAAERKRRAEFGTSDEGVVAELVKTRRMLSRFSPDTGWHGQL